MRRLRLDELVIDERGEAEGFVVRGDRLTSDHTLRVRRLEAPETVVPPGSEFGLEDGDVIWRDSEAWLFEQAPCVREEALERSAVDDWNDGAHWGVLADRLLDHGDPLGAAISAALGQRSSRPIAAHPWVGAHWRHGVLQRLSMGRPEWAHRPDWRSALLELLVARQARFLEEISLDLPRLEPELNEVQLAAVARQLMTLPWPRWLARLHFGVGTLTVVTDQALHQNAPRLARGPLFLAGARGRLVLETASDALALEGLPSGGLALAEGLRVRVFPSKVLFERPSWPRYDSWPSWDFGFHEGRWFLSWRHGAPRSDELKINGMEFFNACLAHGDRIEIGEHVALRVELV